MKRKLTIALILVSILAITANAANLQSILKWVLEYFIQWFALLITRGIIAGSIWLIGNLLEWSPVVFCFPNQPTCTTTPGINAIYPYIINILVPIYIVAMMFTAMFFIMKSGSPAGRVRARKMFFRLMVGMLFVIYSPMLYQSLLDISNRITSFYVDKVNINDIVAVTSYGKAASMCCLQFCMVIVFLVTFIILLIRWFYVYLYSIFFPLILFMYFFEVTKPYGTKYLKDAIKWIFVPPLQALVLYVMVSGPMVAFATMKISGMAGTLQSLFTQMVSSFIILGGMITMCAAPMIMTQILQFVGMAVYSAGLAIDNLPLMSIGGVIAGQGPAAFSAAHGHFSRMRAHDSAVSSMGGWSIAKEGSKAMRLSGGQTGAVEGHGGAVGGGGTGGGGAGGRASESSTATATAKRRGKPEVTSTLGDELEKAGKKGAASGGRLGESYGEESKYDKDVEQTPTKVLSKENLAAERGEGIAEGEGVGGDEEISPVSPKDLAKARKEGEGGKGLFDMLGGRGKAAAAGRTSMIGGVAAPKAGALGVQKGGGVTVGVEPAAAGEAGPVTRVAQTPGTLKRESILTKHPDTIRGGDTIVDQDTTQRDKDKAEEEKRNRDKASRMEKQAGEMRKAEEGVAHAQMKVKIAEAEKEKQGESKREEERKKKGGKK